MQIIKTLILIVSFVSIPLPSYSMDGNIGGNAGKLELALKSAKEHPGLVFAAGLAVGAGVYLYKAARGTQYVLPAVDLKQVEVLNQFGGADYGGGASCGYQALKNALFIAKFGLPETHEDDVRDPVIVQQLFGKNEPIGLWRKLILENNYKSAIKSKLNAQVVSLLVPYKNLPKIPVPVEVSVLDVKHQERFKEKIRGYYVGILSDEICAATVEKIMANLKDATIYTQQNINYPKIALTSVIKNSKREIKAFTIDGKPDIDGLEQFNFEEYVKNNEVIYSYLPSILDGGSIVCTISKQDALESYNKLHPDNGFDKHGDWIKEDDIALLATFERGPHRLLSDMPPYYDGNTVIDNVLLLDDAERSDSKIKEIAARLAASKDFIHTFEVGLMNGEPGKESGERHWITLVVQKRDGKTSWTVADSGGNHSRLKDRIIWTLIKHLTKKA